MNEDRHFYLYAKKHYEITDIIDDLTVIYSKVYGVDLTNSDKKDKTHMVSIILINLVKTHILQYSHLFLQFVADISPENTYRVGYVNKHNSFLLQKNDYEIEYDFNTALIYKCLSVLRLTSVKDIPFSLGEPDENILPLRKHTEADFDK